MNLSIEAQSDVAAAQIQSLLNGAATASLNDLGWISVSGEDRVRWLNGMVTNSINDLTPGQGCYNLILSAQGRIQGTVYAFAESDRILLQTDRAQIPGLLATLDRFIIMDDVELTDITETLTGLALIGPGATSLLTQVNLTIPQALTLESTSWRTSKVNVIAAYSPLVARFELWADPVTIEALTLALAQAGAETVTPEALEHLRILEGTPRYGTDIRDKELAQETGLTRALHFAKGCYLGQEIVERVRSRGNVHRTFSGFRLTGPLPAPGTPIEADGKPVGELTSVAAIPLRNGIQTFGLGYIRREALERNATLTCAGTVVQPVGLPIALPS
jgi:folate-binding protein YgfZ